MTAALVTDLHFGVHNDSENYRELQRRFWSQVFFPTLIKYKVDQVVVLGDIFEKRRNINFSTLEAARKMFFEPLGEFIRKPSYMLVGNHDSYYRDTLAINSLKELCSNISPVIHIVTTPHEAVVDGRRAILAPWICKDNAEKTFALIDAKASHDVSLFAHLELAGFPMAAGHIMHEGMDAKIFSKFGSVYSGHYHQPSVKGNIRYLGAPYELTWADAGSPRGFHIYDGSKDKVEFISNPHKMYAVLDVTKDEEFDFDSVEEGTVVRVVDAENEKLDDLVKKIEDRGAKAEISSKPKGETEHLELSLEDVDDTKATLKRKVELLDVSGDDKNEISSLIDNMYSELIES